MAQYNKKSDRTKELHAREKWAKVNATGKWVVVYPNSVDHGVYVDGDDLETRYNKNELTF